MIVSFYKIEEMQLDIPTFGDITGKRTKTTIHFEALLVFSK